MSHPTLPPSIIPQDISNLLTSTYSPDNPIPSLILFLNKLKLETYKSNPYSNYPYHYFNKSLTPTITSNNYHSKISLLINSINTNPSTRSYSNQANTWFKYNQVQNNQISQTYISILDSPNIASVFVEQSNNIYPAFITTFATNHLKLLTPCYQYAYLSIFCEIDQDFKIFTLQPKYDISSILTFNEILDNQSIPDNLSKIYILLIDALYLGDIYFKFAHKDLTTRSVSIKKLNEPIKVFVYLLNEYITTEYIPVITSFDNSSITYGNITYTATPWEYDKTLGDDINLIPVTDIFTYLLYQKSDLAKQLRTKILTSTYGSNDYLELNGARIQNRIKYLHNLGRHKDSFDYFIEEFSRSNLSQEILSNLTNLYNSLGYMSIELYDQILNLIPRYPRKQVYVHKDVFEFDTWVNVDESTAKSQKYHEIYFEPAIQPVKDLTLEQQISVSLFVKSNVPSFTKDFVNKPHKIIRPKPRVPLQIPKISQTSTNLPIWLITNSKLDFSVRTPNSITSGFQEYIKSLLQIILPDNNPYYFNAWISLLHKLDVTSAQSIPIITSLNKSKSTIITKVPKSSKSSKSSKSNVTHRSKIHKPNNSNDHDILAPEAIIGLLGTNKLRNIIPNFMYTYGLRYYSIPKFEEISNKTLKSGESGPCPHLFLEHIHGKTLSRWVQASGFTTDDFRTVLLLVVNAVIIANREIGFTHYDLHEENIIIKEYQEPVKIKWCLGEDRYIESRYVPYIIDFGLSGMNYNDKRYVTVDDRGLYYISKSVEFVMFDLYRYYFYLNVRMKGFEEYKKTLKQFDVFGLDKIIRNWSVVKETREHGINLVKELKSGNDDGVNIDDIMKVVSDCLVCWELVFEVAGYGWELGKLVRHIDMREFVEGEEYIEMILDEMGYVDRVVFENDVILEARCKCVKDFGLMLEYLKKYLNVLNKGGDDYREMNVSGMRMLDKIVRIPDIQYLIDFEYLGYDTDEYVGRLEKMFDGIVKDGVVGDMKIDMLNEHKVDMGDVVCNTSQVCEILRIGMVDGIDLGRLFEIGWKLVDREIGGLEKMRYVELDGIDWVRTMSEMLLNDVKYLMGESRGSGENEKTDKVGNIDKSDKTGKIDKTDKIVWIKEYLDYLGKRKGDLLKIKE